MPGHYDPNRERERGAGLLQRTARFLRSRDVDEFTDFDRRAGRFFKEIISPTSLREVLGQERDDSSIIPEGVSTRIGAAFAPVRDLVRRGQEMASPTIQIAAARELGKRGLEGAGRMMAEDPLGFLGPGAAWTAPMRPIGVAAKNVVQGTVGIGRGISGTGPSEVVNQMLSNIDQGASVPNPLNLPRTAGRGTQAGRVGSSSHPEARAVPTDPVEELAETITTTPGSQLHQQLKHGSPPDPPTIPIDPAAPLRGLQSRGAALNQRRVDFSAFGHGVGRRGLMEMNGQPLTGNTLTNKPLTDAERTLFRKALTEIDKHYAALDQPAPIYDAIPRGSAGIFDNPMAFTRDIGNVTQFDTDLDLSVKMIARFGSDNYPTNLPERIILPQEVGRRARETGHVIPAYHATHATTDFHSFVPFSHFGTRRAAAQRLKNETGIPYDIMIQDPVGSPHGFQPIQLYVGAHMSGSGAGHRTFPVLIRGKMFEMPDMGSTWDATSVAFYARAERIIPKEVAETAATMNGINEMAAQGYITNELRKRGYTAVRYRNGVENTGSVSYMVFDPSDIRSPFAKFSNKPDRLMDPDLLAGIGGMGMSGAMAEALRQRQAELRGGGER